MNPQEFRCLLERAISRDMDALEEVLTLYEPMIGRFSRIDGEIDEDLRQNLLLHIALNISRFKI